MLLFLVNSIKRPTDQSKSILRSLANGTQVRDELDQSGSSLLRAWLFSGRVFIILQISSEWHLRCVFVPCVFVYLQKENDALRQDYYVIGYLELECFLPFLLLNKALLNCHLFGIDIKI